MQIGRRDSVVQVRCPGEGIFRQPAMRDGAGGVQPGDAGEREYGDGKYPRQADDRGDTGNRSKRLRRHAGSEAERQ